MTNSYEAEKIPCICAMRELFQALAQLESNLQAVHGLHAQRSHGPVQHWPRHGDGRHRRPSGAA